MMRKTLKVLSAVLSYPTAELQAAIPEMRTVLDTEARLPRRNRDRLDRILDEIAAGDLYDLQERYVLLFDRTRSLSLHLFEHVHGESRDRGQAMVDLKALYERHGLIRRAHFGRKVVQLFGGLGDLRRQPPTRFRETVGVPLGRACHGRGQIRAEPLPVANE